MYYNNTIMRIVIFIFLLLPALANAQCFSSPGNPIGGTYNTGALKKGLLRTTIFTRYTSTNKYYEGSKRSDIEQQYDHARYDYVGALVAYGLTPRITFESEIGYFPLKTVYYSKKKYPNLPYYDINGYGFSNWLPSLKTLIYGNNDKRFFLSASVGVKIPFCREPMMKDNVELPVDVQPTTGAYGWAAQFYIMKENSFKATRYFAISRYESNGENVKNYRFGDAFMQSVFFSKHLYLNGTPFPENWTAIIQLRYENRQMNTLNDVDISGTGGYIFLFCPQMNYTIKSKWNISLSGEFPVYQYLNNLQLGRGWAVLLNVTRDFQLKK